MQSKQLQKLCASEVIGFTSGRRDFLEEGWGNVNIPSDKGTGKPLHYSAIKNNSKKKKYEEWQPQRR